MRGNNKAALVLSSGAARGLAHIGVIKALKEKNISIEMIAGSSIGALIGACYAQNKEIAILEEIVLKLDWKRLARLFDPDPTLFFKGIIHGKKIKQLLTALLGEVEFKDLQIPLAVVTCDVDSGEEIIIKEGPVVEAVLASISIPAIFMPVKYQGRFLIDGGMVNPLPVSVAKTMGATFIIAANTIHKPQRRKPFSGINGKSPAAPNLKPQGKNNTSTAINNRIAALIQESHRQQKKFKQLINGLKMRPAQMAAKIDPQMPSIFDTVIQAIYTMEYEIAKVSIKEADLVITPNIGRIAAFEFYRAQEAISEGYQAAQQALKTHSAEIPA